MRAASSAEGARGFGAGWGGGTACSIGFVAIHRHRTAIVDLEAAADVPAAATIALVGLRRPVLDERQRSQCARHRRSSA